MGSITAMKGHIFVIALVSFLAASDGCRAPIKTYKIGIAANSKRDALVLEGLRAGMAELGYIEGQNLEYVNKDIINEEKEKINVQVKELLAQDINIVFVIGEAAESIRKFTKGTSMPVLFSGDPDPIVNGFVKSLSHPGGNATGIINVDSLSKSLELLVNIKPGIKQVWMPYDPNDQFSLKDVVQAEKAAASLKVKLLCHEVRTVEETITEIDNLPKDVDAIFINPSRILFPGISKIIQTAINRGLPTGSSLQSDSSILIVLTTDFYDSGKRVARLAHQIFTGIKPSDIPVETPESLLTINLKTAEKIGVAVPDHILVQAKRFIR
jgi:putative tryptophan/tyrosine transport system substrate-binding protein